jgi:outer membrane lipase/esterase
MSFRTIVRWTGRLAAAALAVAVLASCGGGTQVQAFKPTRILAFGDELSTLGNDGRKYTINAFKIIDPSTSPPTESTTELDCTRNPIWIQTVATAFGLTFDNCLGAATVPSGQVLAAPGAKAADFAGQIAAVQGASPNHSDIAIAMFGMNDILEIYANYPSLSRTQLLDQARARGTALAQQVNALASAGTPVVIVTMPDLGLTPFALSENVTSGDPGRAQLLTDLSTAFNNQMSVALINDGRLIGLVYSDIEMQSEVKFPLAYGYLNVIDSACLPTAPLPTCTTTTVQSDVTPTNYLWADSLMPGPNFHGRLGSLASFRARNNPF